MMKTGPKEDDELWAALDPTVVAQLIQLGKEESEIVKLALNPLLKDKNHQVSSTALLALIGFVDNPDMSLAMLGMANLLSTPFLVPYRIYGEEIEITHVFHMNLQHPEGW